MAEDEFNLLEYNELEYSDDMYHPKLKYVVCDYYLFCIYFLLAMNFLYFVLLWLTCFLDTC